jgi:hypothetical protein
VAAMAEGAHDGGGGTDGKGDDGLVPLVQNKVTWCVSLRFRPPSANVKRPNSSVPPRVCSVAW